VPVGPVRYATEGPSALALRHGGRRHDQAPLPDNPRVRSWLQPGRPRRGLGALRGPPRVLAGDPAEHGCDGSPRRRPGRAAVPAGCGAQHGHGLGVACRT
jgi:hypothetical protein